MHLLLLSGVGGARCICGRALGICRGNAGCWQTRRVLVMRNVSLVLIGDHVHVGFGGKSVTRSGQRAPSGMWLSRCVTQPSVKLVLNPVAYVPCAFSTIVFTESRLIVIDCAPVVTPYRSLCGTGLATKVTGHTPLTIISLCTERW